MYKIALEGAGTNWEQRYDFPAIPRIGESVLITDALGDEKEYRVSDVLHVLIHKDGSTDPQIVLRVAHKK